MCTSVFYSEIQKIRKINRMFKSKREKDFIRRKYGVPTGIRTPVTAVKGRCPRPLDDRDVEDGGILRSRHQTVKEVRRQFVQNIAKQFSSLLSIVQSRVRFFAVKINSSLNTGFRKHSLSKHDST